MRTILIYGPTGCGKTFNAERLRAHFGCTGIIDEWTGPYQYGYLHLTSRRDYYLAKGVEYFTFDQAMEELNAARNLSDNPADEHRG